MVLAVSRASTRMKTALDRVALVTAVAIIVIFALMLGLMLLGWLPQ